MKHSIGILQSWLGVFKQPGLKIEVDSLVDLRKAIIDYPEAKVVGKFHSYNRAALAPVVIIIGPEISKKYFDPFDKTLSVSGAITIEDAMNYCLMHGRRLISSGNHRAQSLIGATLTTHGFGPKAFMAEAVESFIAINSDGEVVAGHNASQMYDENIRCIFSITIKTAPLTSYEVTNCVCRLSKIDPDVKDVARAFAVLPYSGDDPVCIVADYRQKSYHLPIMPEKPKKPVLSKFPWRFWRVKLWWWVDCTFPFLRKIIQRALSYTKTREWKVITDATDIDSMYHAWPSVDSIHDPKFMLYAYRPTYICHNTALFFHLEDLKAALKFAIDEANEIDPTLLRCFIGVRILSTKSDIWWAGNYGRPVAAVDLYCSPKKAHKLIQLQRRLQANFKTISHRGKTVGGPISL